MNNDCVDRCEQWYSGKNGVVDIGGLAQSDVSEQTFPRIMFQFSF